MSQLALEVEDAGALIEGRYRYLLWRGGDRRLCWIMLNPSDADAAQDDPTVRRCRAYAHAWGFRGFVVVNLFALISSDPAELVRARSRGEDPIGPDNYRHVLDAARDASLVVAAWGARGALENRDMQMTAVLHAAGVRLHCVNVTKTGAPSHPLYQRADLRPRRWPLELV